jgi:hypothetical protein
MKTTIFTLGMIALSQAGFAAYHGPILSRSVSPGLVPPDTSVSTNCAIYPNRVVKQVYAGGAQSETTVTFKGGGALLGLIQKAYTAEQNGEVESQPAPTDGPIITLAAYQPVNNGNVAQVTLSARGSANYANKSTAAQMLEVIIEENCK